MVVRFDSKTKHRNGLWDGLAWVSGERAVPGRASPARPISDAQLQDTIWWRKMEGEVPSGHSRLWERDEAYLDDPRLFKVRHHIDFDSPIEMAEVRIPARHAGGAPKPALRRTGRRPTPAAPQSSMDELLELWAGLKVGVKAL